MFSCCSHPRTSKLLSAHLIATLRPTVPQRPIATPQPFRRSITMFKQAVSSFEAKKQAPKPATQPSATKVPKQISIDNALKATSQQFNDIQPTEPLSCSRTQNITNPPFRPPIRAGSMRQKAINDISATFNNTSQSFQENIQPAQGFHDSMQQSSVEALQGAVYWEADDFDDGDLDFDSEPFVPPKLAAAAASLTSQKAPAFSQPLEAPPSKSPTVPFAFQHFETPPSPQGIEIPSSAPLPWSSSPVEHLVPNPPLLKTAQKLPPVTEQVPLSPPIAPMSKRRKLPWASEQTAPVRTAKVARRELSTKTKSAATKTAKNTEQWTGLAAEQIPAAKKEQPVKRSTKPADSMSSGKIDTVQHEGGAKLAKSSNIRPAKIFLSEEQKTVVKLVSESRRSVFFTGPAGTGKSVLLREVIATLKTIHRREQDAVAVTASTGLAACNIGGVTLHSFAGIGLGKEPVPDLVRKIKRNIKAKNRWLRTKVLIIDEISMVDGDLFDKLEAIARQIRNNAFPFGGIQLVITGDFFQLPPIPGGSKPTLFAFDAKTWETSIAHTIGLTHVFRQRDPQFASMLNEMRLGYLSQNTIETFKNLQRPLTFDDGLSATELFSTRPEVERSNNMKLRSLPGESLIFNADDSGGHDKQMRDKLLSSCMAPATIELKVNAQVMLIKNLDDTLVNGSLGRVVGFMNDKMYEIVNENNGLDMEWDDNNGALTKRQEKIRSMARGGNSGDAGQRWPLVSFSLADGTSRQILVQPELWKVELPNGEIQAQRSQLPLILAWALSIHKAQGQTLERVKVDLGRAFEKGQAYVALSRATCKEGLQVLGFQATKVMAHEKVREFYKNLSGAEEAKKALEEEKRKLKAEAKQRLFQKGSRKAARNKEEYYPDSDEF